MNRNTLALKYTKVKFKFGNTVHQSLGTMEFNLKTTDRVIGLNIDIVYVDVPLLLGLDMLDAHRLVINNVENLLEKPADMKEGNIEWKLPLVRQHGHLFIRDQIHIINFSDSELLKLRKHFVHPSVKKIFQLIKRARPAEADRHTRFVLERIRNKCNTCEQGWGKIRPIRIRIRIREYSTNSNFENDRKIRRIRIPT
jgi:hypothetical protein